MTDVNLPGGTQPPWDPMRAMYPRRTWEEPDNRTEDRAWKKLETSDGRRLGLLSFADWVSWVNLAALVVVAIVGLLVVNNVTTRASFLSQAYDESYNVTFEYTPSSAKEWAQQNHPELIDFVTGASDTLTGVPDDIARQAREYRNNAGRRGQGRAFMRVIPPPGFKFPVNLSEDKRRDAIAEMRRQPKSSWKGILYYRFPEIGQERVEAFTMPGLDLIARLIPEWQDPVTVLQFEGHAISAPGKPPELCLDFTQDGKSYSRFSMKFQFESRASGPPVVPRNGSLIFPRPRPASTDAVVTKSDEPCRAADDGFVLGMMRLE